MNGRLSALRLRWWVVGLTLTVALVAAVPAHALVIVLADGTISGTVSAGGALPYAPIYLWKQGSDSKWVKVDRHLTDGSGQYAFGFLTDGSYRVGFEGRTVGGSWYSPAYYSGSNTLAGATTITIVSGSDHAGINLSTSEPFLTVINIQGNSATPWDTGAPVTVWNADTGAMARNYRFGQTGLTYGITHLEPGRWKVQAHEENTRIGWYNSKFLKSQANVVDTTGGGTTSNISITLLPGASRLAGATRYSTAVEVQRQFHGIYEGNSNLVIASGDDAAAVDALSAAGLCWAYDGAPLMLVSKYSTSAELKQAVCDMYEENAYVNIRIVGGAASVPDARITDLRNHLATKYGALAASQIFVTRVSGSDRYSTAAAVRAKMVSLKGGSMPAQVLLVNGADSTKFFDALACSAASADKGVPILLVKAGSVPAPTASAVASYSAANIYVAGGTGTVYPSVLSGLGVSEANRIAGADRYKTALAVANKAMAMGWLPFTGYDIHVVGKLPDALAAGSLGSGPIVITPTAAMQQSTLDWISSRASGGFADNVYVIGGTGSVSDGVLSQLHNVLD